MDFFRIHCKTCFINPPHPFSIVLNRFWYFTQDLLRTIEPLENNRKWVWYVYKQHNNLVVGLVFEIQDLALRTTHSSKFILRGKIEWDSISG